MISFISKSVTKIFGTKSERDIKALMPIVESIKIEYAKLASLTDDELRGKTAEFKSRIAASLADIDNQITSLHTSAEETEEGGEDEVASANPVSLTKPEKVKKSISKNMRSGSTKEKPSEA